jgi:hypothetical protein
MINIADIMTDLQNKQWNKATWHIKIPERSQAIYSFQKTFHSGVDVIVSVHQENEGFVVWSSAEHRLSGPSDSMTGNAPTVEEALLLAQNCCHDWDKAM